MSKHPRMSSGDRDGRGSINAGLFLDEAHGVDEPLFESVEERARRFWAEQPFTVQELPQACRDITTLLLEVRRLRAENEDLRRSRMAWALKAEAGKDGQVLSLIDAVLDSYRAVRDAARSDEEALYAHGAINALHLLRKRIEATA